MYFSHFMKCTSPFPVTNLRAHPGRFCPHPWKGQRPCSIIGCRPNPAFNRVKRSWGGQPKGFENENIFQVRTELHILIINSNRNIFVRIVEQHGPCSSGLCALEINRFAVHTKLENFAAAVLFSKIPQYTYIIHDKMSYKSYAVWFQNNQCDTLTYILTTFNWVFFRIWFDSVVNEDGQPESMFVPLLSISWTHINQSEIVFIGQIQAAPKNAPQKQIYCSWKYHNRILHKAHVEYWAPRCKPKVKLHFR